MKWVPSLSSGHVDSTVTNNTPVIIFWSYGMHQVTNSKSTCGRETLAVGDPVLLYVSSQWSALVKQISCIPASFWENGRVVLKRQRENTLIVHWSDGWFRNISSTSYSFLQTHCCVLWFNKTNSLLCVCGLTKLIHHRYLGFVNVL